MTDIEFRDWLNDEVRDGRLNPRQRDDLLQQKSYFDENRIRNQQAYPHQVVGYVGGTRVTGGTVREILNQARESRPGGMVYFEPIGFDLF
jgi:hypothetical protein